MNFEAQHSQYIEQCEEEIKNAIANILSNKSIVSKAAEYSLLNGGKRVRGILTQAVTHLLGGELHPSVNFSAAIEMIHAFSLIHDDLPCMDNDDMRRGKPACHIAFGEANALLAGDLLSLAAFSTIASAANATSTMVQKATLELANSSGAKGMIYGQELDILAENKILTKEELIEVHRYKTGALITCASKLGIIAANQELEEHISILQYAETLGLVFQIMDDVLDVTSDSTTLGKPVGSDTKNAKNTFVSLMGVEKSIETANTLTQNSIQALQQTYGEKADFLCDFALRLVTRLH